jgi:hypothetical protein
MEFFDEDKASTPLYRYHLLFAITPHHSQIGIIFHSYLLVPMGEKVKRALKRLRFWRLMPKGRNIKPKAKGPHTTNFKILIYLQKFVFPIGIL